MTPFRAMLDTRLLCQSDPVTLAGGSVVWVASKDDVSNMLLLRKVRCRQGPGKHRKGLWSGH